jgi:hypothetical protein
METPFTVTCINDANRPKEIPLNQWVVKNQKYTVINVIVTMPGKKGFILKEITLGKATFPYDSFNPLRFAVIESNADEIEAEESVNELMKELCLIEN